jgi:hypothetical protein
MPRGFGPRRRIKMEKYSGTLKVMISDAEGAREFQPEAPAITALREMLAAPEAPEKKKGRRLSPIQPAPYTCPCCDAKLGMIGSKLWPW